MRGYQMKYLTAGFNARLSSGTQATGGG